MVSALPTLSAGRNLMNAHSVPLEFPDLSDESIAELVTAIDRVGYGIVSNYLARPQS
jgi:hypothetical protein